MSFYSALNGLGLEKGIFAKFDVPNVFDKIFSAIESILGNFANTIKRFSIGKTLEISENWNYHTDVEKNIEILDVERDPNALEKTKNALRYLFS